MKNIPGRFPYTLYAREGFFVYQVKKDKKDVFQTKRKTKGTKAIPTKRKMEEMKVFLTKKRIERIKRIKRFSYKKEMKGKFFINKY